MKPLVPLRTRTFLTTAVATEFAEGFGLLQKAQVRNTADRDPEARYLAFGLFG